jgi:two-component system sensor histidine kinase BaeS
VKSLRAREFVSIAVAILVAVGVTLAIAVLLVRRSARHEALKSLQRQAALIAAQQRATPGGQRLTSLGAFFETQQEHLAIISIPQAALLLPRSAGTALRSGKAVDGSVDVSGKHYLFAARPESGRAIVLLRQAKLEASDWHPFVVAFAIAAAVGAALAAAAAFLLAGAVARPIRRVALASRRLAAGERPGPLPVEGSTELASLAAAFNQMAEDLERAKDAERSFLLSVSHELKTPLAAIRGHGEALLDGVMAVPKAAGVVVSEAKRLERLVRDLLDLGRLNQRTFAVAPQPVDLAELADEALQRHEPEAQRLGIALVAETAGPAPATADPDRVLQVLSNLIENALRTTPAGGEIVLTAAPGSLTIADTGPGLAAEELPRAFERFFLYERYGKNRAVGTGLGLAIVKELTEAMGGAVTVESAPGRGTSFVVSLPDAEFLHSEHAAKASR